MRVQVLNHTYCCLFGQVINCLCQQMRPPSSLYLDGCGADVRAVRLAQHGFRVHKVGAAISLFARPTTFIGERKTKFGW